MIRISEKGSSGKLANSLGSVSSFMRRLNIFHIIVALNDRK